MCEALISYDSNILSERLWSQQSLALTSSKILLECTLQYIQIAGSSAWTSGSGVFAGGGPPVFGGGGGTFFVAGAKSSS